MRIEGVSRLKPKCAAAQRRGALRETPVGLTERWHKSRHYHEYANGAAKQVLSFQGLVQARVAGILAHSQTSVLLIARKPVFMPGTYESEGRNPFVPEPSGEKSQQHCLGRLRHFTRRNHGAIS